MDADGDFVITWQSYTPDSVKSRQRLRHRGTAFLAVQAPSLEPGPSVITPNAVEA